MRRAWKIIGGIVGVLVLLAVGIAIYIFATAIKPERPVGFQVVKAEDPGHGPIAVAMWYPTDAKPGFTLLGSQGARLASDAPVAGERLPLIVISHGTGGLATSHADTAIALAERGFVVAAPTHPGDNFQDDTSVGKPEWLANRARQVERVIDMALGSWKGRTQVDPSRVGLFGFSAGATTALINIGGTPDLRRIASQCAERPEFVCKLVSPATYRSVQPIQWRSDPRIRAAVVAAPGLGFTFEPDQLSKVRAAVQLWAASDDQIVPIATNAGAVSRLLPQQPPVQVVRRAQHYSFLMPCGLLGPPQLCRDPKGFDRAEFHRDFNASVADFFKSHLPPR